MQTADEMQLLVSPSFNIFWDSARPKQLAEHFLPFCQYTKKRPLKVLSPTLSIDVACNPNVQSHRLQGPPKCSAGMHVVLTWLETWLSSSIGCRGRQSAQHSCQHAVLTWLETRLSTSIGCRGRQGGREAGRCHGSRRSRRRPRCWGMQRSGRARPMAPLAAAALLSAGPAPTLAPAAALPRRPAGVDVFLPMERSIYVPCISASCPIKCTMMYYTCEAPRFWLNVLQHAGLPHDMRAASLMKLTGLESNQSAFQSNLACCQQMTLTKGLRISPLPLVCRRPLPLPATACDINNKFPCRAAQSPLWLAGFCSTEAAASLMRRTYLHSLLALFPHAARK